MQVQVDLGQLSEASLLAQQEVQPYVWRKCDRS